MNTHYFKAFILIGTCILVGTGSAQIEAIWPDPMVLNDPFEVEQDTTIDVSALNLGTASGGQAWVFTDTLDADTSQSEWIAVSGTPYDTAFAEADYVEHFWQFAPHISFAVREDWIIDVPAQMVEMFRYHKKEPDWVRTLGMGFQYDLMWGAPYVYDAPSFFYPETLSISTEPWLEMYSFETNLVAFIPSVVTDSTWIEVDAWGELSIPAGTFDCIRVKRHEFRKIYVTALDTSATLETYTYTWFNQEFQPILSISSQATRGDTLETANLVTRFKGVPEDTTSSVCDPLCRRVNNTKPNRFELNQNYPNPFNPETTIRFSLAAPARVQLDIFNVLGRQVDQIHAGYSTEGTYELNWDSSNQNGQSLPSGIYYYRITAEPVSGASPYSQTRKMILLQ